MPVKRRIPVAKLLRHVQHSGLRHALRTATAAVVTLAVVTALRLPQGYWAVVTAVIVMQANLGGSIQASWARLAGTAIGAVSGALAASLGGQAWYAVGGAVFVTLAACTGVARLRESSRVAGITAVIVILGGHPGASAWQPGLDRFLEISLGILTALAVSVFVLPSRASRALDHGLAAIFEDVAACFALVVEGRLHEESVERRVFALKDRILRTLARCRELRREAGAEGVSGEAEAQRAMLLFRAERLFEHVLAMDHVATEWRGKGLHRHLPGELAGLEAATAEVLTGLGAHLRRREPLPDLARLGESVKAAREKLAAMRRERAPAAYDLSEVMHFFSFMHGMLSCAADAGEIVRRLRAAGDD
ncbi:MAG: FUSC family protein [Solidesulfovibrio sp.]|uniref:FUSC family protein n=1 Tax=Solidesulfovibrio sp. TaxID=2910990 RepID=UPI002B206D74|nr:FUSC family protein [Solidesulfovibrio sp.]MEA4855145.1 FUSC family protein [Solidesulfovibrio sp.]